MIECLHHVLDGLLLDLEDLLQLLARDVQEREDADGVLSEAMHQVAVLNLEAMLLRRFLHRRKECLNIELNYNNRIDLGSHSAIPKYLNIT